MTKIFIDYFCENGLHVRNPSCVDFSAQKTVHCNTKNAYISEITFLALVPCKESIKNVLKKIKFI